MTRRMLLLVAALLVSPVNSWAQTTLLVLDSQPGDWVGGGLKQTFNEVDGRFEASRNYANGVSFSFFTPDNAHWWYLNFAGPDGAPLAPGLYKDAVGYPGQGCEFCCRIRAAP